jgi:hypothetical protein
MKSITQELSHKAAQELVQRLCPRPAESHVAIAASGHGPGFWTGAPSAVWASGTMYLAYRVRQPITLGRGQGVVIAKSSDGVRFETILTISKDEMEAESLERPTLVLTPEGKWRLYLSCATTGTKHWRVEMLEADSPLEFVASTRQVVLAGSDLWGIKDTVITWRDGTWHLWATSHPLDKTGHEDRMVSDYFTSRDGIVWDMIGTCLRGRPGMWDSRGARITAVEFVGSDCLAFYDGRATAEENYDERTGVAFGKGPDEFVQVSDRPVAESVDGKACRYLNIVKISGHQYRLYYELARPDGSHELRTELR